MKSAGENGRKEIGSIHVCKALNVEEGNYKPELEELNERR